MTKPEPSVDDDAGRRVHVVPLERDEDADAREHERPAEEPEDADEHAAPAGILRRRRRLAKRGRNVGQRQAVLVNERRDLLQRAGAVGPDQRCPSGVTQPSA